MNKIRNVFIIFLVSGFGHGSNWTCIIWGALNALFFLPIFITNNNRTNLDIVAKGKHFPSIKEFLSMLLTFGLTVFLWIFFRAENIGHAINYISTILSASLFSIPKFPERGKAITTIILVTIFMLIEWKGREEKYAIADLEIKLSAPLRYAMYYAIIIAIIWFSGKEQQFIYFQF